MLLGHVDAAAVGPAVFYKLGDLAPGDLVYVTRKDHQTAVFRVTAVALYPEQDFPTKQVYGFTPGPTLRLITCGGDFDEQTHHVPGPHHRVRRLRRGAPHVTAAALTSGRPRPSA